MPAEPLAFSHILRPHSLLTGKLVAKSAAEAGSNPMKKAQNTRRYSGPLKRGSRPVSRVLCRLRGSSHSSRPAIAHWLKQPTRPQRGPRQWGPIWSCSGWSLPCHELLPVARCALTAPFHPYLILLTQAIGGLLSVALVVGLRLPGVTWHPALWSPDFPLPCPSTRRYNDKAATALANSGADYRG